MDFYGHPEASKREGSWNLLPNLIHSSNTPWFCFRDFNEITSKSERWGVGFRPQGQMTRFQEVLNYYEPSNIPTQGQRHTWYNNRRGPNFTKKRLDRAMSNLRGLDCYSGSSCLVLPTIKLDHSPLIISITKNNLLSKKDILFSSMRQLGSLERTMLMLLKRSKKNPFSIQAP